MAEAVAGRELGPAVALRGRDDMAKGELERGEAQEGEGRVELFAWT